MTIKHFICIGLCCYSLCLNGQTPFNVIKEKLDTLEIGMSLADKHMAYHLKALVNSDSCTISYDSYCGTDIFHDNSKRQLTFEAGYIVCTNTQKYKHYKLDSGILHLKWKDPDEASTHYTVFVNSLLDDDLAVFSIEGKEALIRYPENKPIWLIKIVSENCRQSLQTIVDSK